MGDGSDRAAPPVGVREREGVLSERVIEGARGALAKLGCRLGPRSSEMKRKRGRAMGRLASGEGMGTGLREVGPCGRVRGRSRPSRPSSQE